jgi:hypothetical protein
MDDHNAIQVEFRAFKGGYQARVAIRNEESGWSSGTWINQSDAPQFLELDWQASTSPLAMNGSQTFQVDGVQSNSLTAIDNDTRRIDSLQFGAVLGVPPTTRGTIHLDEFESRRQSYIGP